MGLLLFETNRSSKKDSAKADALENRFSNLETQVRDLDFQNEELSAQNRELTRLAYHLQSQLSEHIQKSKS